MFLGKRRSPLEKEWLSLLKAEDRFLRRQSEKKVSLISKKLEALVPGKLQQTLNLAFYKAFQTVFEKGTPFIEKTYKKEKAEYTYKINSYAMSLKESKKNLKSFSKQSGISQVKNLAVSGIEGIGLGALGIGIPDIPLFTGLILKSIYEIAASYGYSCETKAEQNFLLLIISTSLAFGSCLEEGNQVIDQYIEKGVPFKTCQEELIKQTAQALSDELLYMKFLQGIPIAGIIGGLSDSVCLKKISSYADLKYKKRFLFQKNFLSDRQGEL